MVSNSNIFIFIFGVDNSVSLHTVDRKKDITITGEVPTHGLDGTVITVLSLENICLSLHNFRLTAFGMLIVYKSTNSKQISYPYYNHINYVWEIFENTLQ